MRKPAINASRCFFCPLLLFAPLTSAMRRCEREKKSMKGMKSEKGGEFIVDQKNAIKTVKKLITPNYLVQISK